MTRGHLEVEIGVHVIVSRRHEATVAALWRRHSICKVVRRVVLDLGSLEVQILAAQRAVSGRRRRSLRLLLLGMLLRPLLVLRLAITRLPNSVAQVLMELA